MRLPDARELARQLARQVKGSPGLEDFRREGEEQEACEECGAVRSSLGPIFHWPDCVFR